MKFLLNIMIALLYLSFTSVLSAEELDAEAVISFVEQRSAQTAANLREMRRDDPKQFANDIREMAQQIAEYQELKRENPDYAEPQDRLKNRDALNEEINRFTRKKKSAECFKKSHQ